MNGVTARRGEIYAPGDAEVHGIEGYAGVPTTPKYGPTTCDYGPGHDYDACGWETIVNSKLYIQGKGDIGEVDANDIQQRGVGSCHVFGPALALAASPEGRARLREMIKELPSENGKRRFEVTFRSPDTKVIVDDSFVKGHAATADREGVHQEIWPLVLESAYAQLRGGMQKMGHGGREAAAFEAITGKKAESRFVGNGLLDASVKEIRAAFYAGKPMCVCLEIGAGTFGKSAEYAFDLHANHSYAVAAIYEKDGETFLQLKNPWGYADPAPLPMHLLSAWRAQITIGQKP